MLSKTLLREAIGVVCKLRSASCVDDVPCIHYRVGYLFPVVPVVVVVVFYLAEAQGLGLPVVGHTWVDECLQLPDPPGFFDFAAPTVVGDDGLQKCDLLEV